MLPQHYRPHRTAQKPGYDQCCHNSIDPGRPGTARKPPRQLTIRANYPISTAENGASEDSAEPKSAFEFPDFETAKIALEVARESVAKQQTDFRDMRTAAAALLTATSVVVSFLGGRALNLHRFPLLAVAGVAFFVLSLVWAITVLIPSRKRGIKEIASGSALFDLTLDRDKPGVDAYVRLTQTFDEIYDESDEPRRRLEQRLVVAAAFVVLQTGVWGAMIVLANRTSTHPKAARLPVDTHLPVIGGRARPGGKLSCSRGTWANAPTSFAYQWDRDRSTIEHATRDTYVVHRRDEGLTLTCVVAASNRAGKVVAATSHGVRVAGRRNDKAAKDAGSVRH